MNNVPDSSIDEDSAAYLAEYAMGVLPPDTASEVERRLNVCRANVSLADQYMQTVRLMGVAVPPAEPPAGHKGRFMARLAGTAQEPLVQPITASATAQSPAASLSTLSGEFADVARPRAGTAPGVAEVTTGRVIDLKAYRERRAPGALAWVASVAAVLALLFGVWALWSNGERGRAESDLAAANQKSAQAAQALTSLGAAVGSVPDGSLVFRLQGKESLAGASAVCIVDPKTNQVAVVATGVERLPSDKVYELWWLPADKSISPIQAGTFNADEAGTARHIARAPRALDRYAGVAVTVEPAPGVPKATGPVVLVANYTIP